MAIYIMSDASSAASIANLSRLQSRQAENISRLSSGQRINSSSDDAEGIKIELGKGRETQSKGIEAPLNSERENVRLRHLHELEVEKASETSEASRPPRAASVDTLSSSMASRAISAYRIHAEQSSLRDNDT